MQLIFLYGQPASGKLTVARALERLSGLPVFHNHLAVDAVGAVFPFGSEPFVRLREQVWLMVIEAAALAGRSLIFTYAPEATVDPGFPARVAALVAAVGGETLFIRLTVSRAAQEQRIDAESRHEFGKLRSLELLRTLRANFAAAEALMPAAAMEIDTGQVAPEAAAARIATRLGLGS